MADLKGRVSRRWGSLLNDQRSRAFSESMNPSPILPSYNNQNDLLDRVWQSAHQNTPWRPDRASYLVTSRREPSSSEAMSIESSSDERYPGWLWWILGLVVISVLFFFLFRPHLARLTQEYTSKNGPSNWLNFLFPSNDSSSRTGTHSVNSTSNSSSPISRDPPPPPPSPPESPLPPKENKITPSSVLAAATKSNSHSKKRNPLLCSAPQI